MSILGLCVPIIYVCACGCACVCVCVLLYADDDGNELVSLTNRPAII